MTSIIRDMDLTRINTQVRVKHCSLCQGDTVYYCHHCQQNMCLQCKKIHVINLDTKGHEVTRYAEKTKISPKQVGNAKSPNPDYHKPGEVLVSGPDSICDEEDRGLHVHSSRHRPRRFLPPVLLSPLDDRRQYSERIYCLREETLYCRQALLEDLRYDVKTGHKKVTIQGQSKAKDRAQELKDLIDKVLTGNLYDRCQIQKTRLSKHICRLKKYERRYEEYSCRPPVEYLQFIKHKRDPRKDEQKLIKALVQIMKRMKLSTETGKRKAENELLLTLMPFPVLQKSFTVKDVNNCVHISFETPDLFWVSDNTCKSLVLKNTTGDKLDSVDNLLHVRLLLMGVLISVGFHTVNSERELIYINKDYNINKLSSDRKKPPNL